MAPYQYGTWFSVGRFHTELQTREVAEGRIMRAVGRLSISLWSGPRQIHTTWIVGFMSMISTHVLVSICGNINTYLYHLDHDANADASESVWLTYRRTRNFLHPLFPLCFSVFSLISSGDQNKANGIFLKKKKKFICLNLQRRKRLPFRR